METLHLINDNPFQCWLFQEPENICLGSKTCIILPTISFPQNSTWFLQNSQGSWAPVLKEMRPGQKETKQRFLLIIKNSTSRTNMEEFTFNYSERRKALYLTSHFPQLVDDSYFLLKSHFVLSRRVPKQHVNCGATSHIPEEKLTEGYVSRARLKKAWESSFSSRSSDSGSSPAFD